MNSKTDPTKSFNWVVCRKHLMEELMASHETRLFSVRAQHAHTHRVAGSWHMASLCKALDQHMNLRLLHGVGNEEEFVWNSVAFQFDQHSRR